MTTVCTSEGVHLRDGLAPRGRLQVQNVDVVVPAATGAVPLKKHRTFLKQKHDHVWYTVFLFTGSIFCFTKQGTW